MQGFELDFLLAIVKRHLRWAAVIAAAVAGIGLTVTLLLPTVYRATSSILIESPQIPEGLAKSTVPVSGLDQIQIIEQQMLTSDNLLKLADKFNIFPDRKELTDAEIVDAMRSRTGFIEIPFQSRSGAGGTTAFALTFDASNAELAAVVSSEIANQILLENVRVRTETASDTLKFFEQDAARLNAELSKLESEILTFKTDNKDALPDSLDFRRNEQAAQQERLAELQREEAALRDRKATLAKTFETIDLTTPDRTRPATPEEEVLAGLRKSLVEQRLVYSEKSEAIKSLRQQIDRLEKQIKARRATQQGQSEKKIDNKAPSEYDIRTAEIDGRLNYIAEERASIEESLAMITKSILATPANEVTLNVLERNYSNLQQQYNSVTAKLAEASTGEQIELRSKGVKFSVIELATPPQKPLTSKRYALAGGTLFAAIGLGFAFIVLRELLTPGVRRPVDIERHLQLRPFITIPYVYTKAEVRWKWLVFAVTLMIATVVIPAMITTFHARVMPIDLLLSKLTHGRS
jgi:polysaccharide biosynthesis transport protein